MEETVGVTRLSQIHYRVAEMGVSVCVCVGGGADVCEEGSLRNRQENSSSHCNCSSRLASRVYPGPICSDGSSGGQLGCICLGLICFSP